MMEWIKITERLPPEKELVLVVLRSRYATSVTAMEFVGDSRWKPDLDMVSGYEWEYDYAWSEGYPNPPAGDLIVTHWMPLPPAPTDYVENPPPKGG
jgi:hypothetical protein